MKKLFRIILLLSVASKLFGDVVLYDEPMATRSWNTTESHSIGGTIELDSYNNPYSGFECIEGTLVQYEGRFSVTLGAGWIDPTQFTALVYHIRQKNQGAGRMNVHAWGGAQSDIHLGVKATVGLSKGQYGLVGTNITTYQTITIPMSAFAFPAGTIVNRFMFAIVNNNSGFYIDDIVLVGSGVVQYPDPYPPATATPTP
jgi:hypothetical protein